MVSSSPKPTETPEPGVDLEANAQLLAEVVDKIDESAKGFAQILQNPAKLKLHIYWKGEPPAEVKALEGTTGTGVEVVLVEAKLSKADVNAAIARISQAAQAGTVPAPDSISANKDYSGITDRLRGVPVGREQQRDRAGQVRGRRRRCRSRSRVRTPTDARGAATRDPAVAATPPGLR